MLPASRQTWTDALRDGLGPDRIRPSGAYGKLGVLERPQILIAANRHGTAEPAHEVDGPVVTMSRAGEDLREAAGGLDPGKPSSRQLMVG